MSLLRDYINGEVQSETKGDVGIAGFKTVAIISDNIKHTREAPTTYLEDGTHVNDHIIRNPIIISIEGDVSNVHTKPSTALRLVRESESTFGAVAQYLPGRTQAQLSKVSGIISDIQTQIDRVDELIRTGQNVADFAGYQGRSAGEFIQDTFNVNGLGGDRATKTNIENFIDKMNGLLESDALVTIDGPLRQYKDMCIISFEYTANSSSEAISFSLEAQQLRFATIKKSNIAKKPDKKTNGQHAGEVKKGAQEGKKPEQSVLSKYGGKVVNFIKKKTE